MAAVDDSMVPDKYKLNTPETNTGKPGALAMIAVIAGVLALGVAGYLTFLIYQHWESLQVA